MSFSLYNYSGGSWVDISDYVVGASPIPFISMNSDWTLRAEIFTIDVAGSIIADLPGGYSFDVGDKIKTTMDSDFLISGRILSSNYVYEEEKYSLEIESDLFKLKDKFVSYANMHDAFAAGDSTQFWTDYLAYNSVQVLWALEKAFTVNGLTLNVPSSIKTTALFTRATSTGSWNEREITYADLYFDEYQLYCLGMSSAVAPTIAITTGYELRPFKFMFLNTFVRVPHIHKKNSHDPEVDCFDFVSEILTSLRLAVKQTDDSAYELVASTGNYSVADDDKYSYNSQELKKIENSVGWGWVTLNPSGNWSITSSNRDKYYSEVTETEISEVSVGGDAKVSIMPNFRILFADTSDFSSEYNEAVCEPDADSSLIIDDGMVTGHLNPVAMRYSDLGLARTVETIICPADDTFKTVIENFIDLEKQTSSIIQETFA